ncbi:hypothetical protein GCM10027269_42890 [Kribbella endophytica]
MPSPWLSAAAALALLAAGLLTNGQNTTRDWCGTALSPQSHCRGTAAPRTRVEPRVRALRRRPARPETQANVLTREPAPVKPSGRAHSRWLLHTTTQPPRLHSPTTPPPHHQPAAAAPATADLSGRMTAQLAQLSPGAR